MTGHEAIDAEIVPNNEIIRRTQTVYDAEGTAYVLEPIDAKEYLQSGHYFQDPPAANAAALPQA